LKEFVNSNTFIVTESFTDEDINFKKETDMFDIFVFGQEVNDYHIIDKDNIFTLTTAAVKELDQNQQNDKLTGSSKIMK
jgi:hypothetical protein